MKRGKNMWTEEQIIEYLKKNLRKSRLEHSLSVRDTAVKLAEIYGGDIEKAKIAGLVHDCAKYIKDEEMLNICEKYGYNIDEVSRNFPNILHGHAGAYIANNVMGIEDKDVLNAIAYHTTGRKNMSLLEKIIYIADYIEPLRDFNGVEEIRKIVYDGKLHEALIMSFNNTIKYILDRNALLHKDTIDARNYMLYTIDRWKK
ncbi:putative nicotinate-nucleotide adenylyltransferase [Clostridium thermopalmarium DSM 5974]|uniref:bis(5'-nucleosyl)-tetraphosphatase (symmetrical) n=3 Tax=Clostridiaceae TaxID=31979 RepID=A0A151ALN2_9CLOT|nr:ribonuclease Y [Clostridium colicanis DSM 13634]PRR74159.1 putative nicotinate-nucleotide adenylyltransferase [Clostridium thermopalmarium DSM 5974]PVZ25487.1 putative HD superfamily hydrolase involved in NAD metabolism [Clostridium thermopalmarium DSM 5974]